MGKVTKLKTVSMRKYTALLAQLTTCQLQLRMANADRTSLYDMNSQAMSDLFDMKNQRDNVAKRERDEADVRIAQIQTDHEKRVELLLRHGEQVIDQHRDTACKLRTVLDAAIGQL